MLALYGKADVAERQPDHVFQRRHAFVIQTHQRFIRIRLREDLAHLLFGHARFQAAGDGFKDPAREAAQMRRENDVRTQMRRDFRVMAVIKHAIRLKAHFAEAIRDRRFAPCSAHAAGGVDHRPLVQIQQTCVDQRFQGKLRRRRVAARHGNQIRFFEFVCAPLRQAVNRFFKQIGVLMGETVIFFVERAVVNAERAGEIEHHAAGCQELRCQVMTDFVRSG